MAKILFGDQVVDENVVMTSLININSPLTFDATMMGALEVYAAAGQACIVSPFIVGGAMAPVSVIGTLTQVLAEVLAGVAYSQLVRPGAPVIAGALRHLDRHEFGRADLWHARGGADHLWSRSTGAPVWGCRTGLPGRSVVRNCLTRRRGMRRRTR